MSEITYTREEIKSLIEQKATVRFSDLTPETRTLFEDEVRRHNISRLLRVTGLTGVHDEASLRLRIKEYIEYNGDQVKAVKLSTLNQRFGVFASKYETTVRNIIEELAMAGDVTLKSGKRGSLIIFSRGLMNEINKDASSREKVINALIAGAE